MQRRQLKIEKKAKLFFFFFYPKQERAPTWERGGADRWRGGADHRLKASSPLVVGTLN